MPSFAILNQNTTLARSNDIRSVMQRSHSLLQEARLMTGDKGLGPSSSKLTNTYSVKTTITHIRHSYITLHCTTTSIWCLYVSMEKINAFIIKIMSNCILYNCTFSNS